MKSLAATCNRNFGYCRGDVSSELLPVSLTFASVFFALRGRGPASRAIVVMAGVVVNLLLAWACIFGSVTTAGITRPHFAPGIVVSEVGTVVAVSLLFSRFLVTHLSQAGSTSFKNIACVQIAASGAPLLSPLADELFTCRRFSASVYVGVMRSS